VLDFKEKLRQAMYERHCRAIDVAEATGISASAICRYLSGTNKPSSEKIIALAKYLLVSPQWLLDSSEGHMRQYSDRDMTKVTEPLLKQLEDKEKIIKHLEKDVERLEAKVKKWEDWKASSKERHAKGKAKADLAIAKNKNTLRIKTTRKRKK